jgi:PAS domain S-box-containing protein
VLPRRLDRDAETGRGLQLVEAMADRFGVEIGDTAKTVWFELRPDGGDRPASTWDVPAATSQSQVGIRLLGMPVGLSRAALRHRGALVREAQLALASGAPDLGVRREDLVATAAINDALDAAFASVYAGLAAETGAADCTINVPAGCGPAAATLAWVMDTLNETARSGALLTRPALPEVRRFRLWMIGEILRQLEGDPPTRWTSTPESENHTPADPVAWDTARILDSDTPTVAADDDNLILAVNEAAASTLRWEASELAGRRLTAIIPSAYRERHVAGFTNFLLTGKSRIIGVPVKVAALRGDGTTVPIVLTVRVEHTVTGRAVFVGELRPAG